MSGSLPYDGGYRHIFSHPVMVEHLLRGFVPQAWAAQLDFSTLDRRNAHYVSEDLRQRSDDVVWRVRARHEARWLYVYLLMEFQSRSDDWMALRLLAYVSLLYQDLLKSREVRGTGELPPVFPLVLYNGARRWRAPLDMDGLMGLAPGELDAYRPRFRYFLLDGLREGREPGMRTQADGADNLVAGLLRLEAATEPPDLPAHIIWLDERLRAPEHASLRRAITVYVNRVVVPRVAPEIAVADRVDLPEVADMLAETMDAWMRKWKREGLAEGRREGRQEGRQEGLQEGLQEGRQEGLQEGRLEGRREALRHILAARFGEPLPDWVHERLAAAGEAELQAFTVAGVSAPSLEAVFASS